MLFVLWWCVVRGCPSIYTRRKVVLGAILGVRTELHYLCMEAWYRLSKERQRSTDRGSATP